jgi:hypothetical protein
VMFSILRARVLAWFVNLINVHVYDPDRD